LFVIYKGAERVVDGKPHRVNKWFGPVGNMVVSHTKKVKREGMLVRKKRAGDGRILCQ